MRSMVLAAGVVAVVALGGVPTAAVLAAGGSHAHHAAPAPTTESDTSDAKADEADNAAGEAPEKDHGHAGAGHASQNAAIARAHQAGMKQWAACVRTAAKAGHGSPTAHCVKPLPPGWVKHPGKHPASQHPRH